MAPSNVMGRKALPGPNTSKRLSQYLTMRFAASCEKSVTLILQLVQTCSSSIIVVTPTPTTYVHSKDITAQKQEQIFVRDQVGALLFGLFVYLLLVRVHLFELVVEFFQLCLNESLDARWAWQPKYVRAY